MTRVTWASTCSHRMEFDPSVWICSHQYIWTSSYSVADSLISGISHDLFNSWQESCGWSIPFSSLAVKKFLPPSSWAMGRITSQRGKLELLTKVQRVFQPFLPGLEGWVMNCNHSRTKLNIEKQSTFSLPQKTHAMHPHLSLPTSHIFSYKGGKTAQRGR